MSTLDRSRRNHHLRLIASVATLAIVLGACGSDAAPSTIPVTPQPTIAEPSATPAPTPSPTPAPTPKPTPLPTPSASPSAAPSPSPSAPAARMVDDWVWTYEKRPLTLAGEAGTTTWSKVLFATNTASLKWTATPETSAGCTFRYRLESSALSKPAAATQKVKGAKAASGTRNLTVKYADGKLTVTTDCKSYKVKLTATGHPGVVIKQANDPSKATGTTATELNDALAESYGDWSLNTSTRYYSGGTIRVSTYKITIPIQYELPKWTPPEGTDPALVAAWTAALKNMRRHTEGEAAIGIQAAGRYLASLSKKRFPSVAAMNRYLDDKSEKQFEWARDKAKAYNEATQYGWTQGGFIP